MAQKAALKKCTIAVTGDFGKSKPPEKIKHWVEFQGGTFASKIDANVTHLVASQEHFKKNVAMGESTLLKTSIERSQSK